MEYVEDFNNWNIQKQALDESLRTSAIYFKEGDIWWVSLGRNIGTESYGKGEKFKRPVLMIKKLSSGLCIAVPLTTKKKIGSWFVEISIHEEKRWVLLQHIRSIDKKRFWVKIAEVNPVDLLRVKEKLEVLLELSKNRHLAN